MGPSVRAGRVADAGARSMRRRARGPRRTGERARLDGETLLRGYREVAALTKAPRAAERHERKPHVEHTLHRHHLKQLVRHGGRCEHPVKRLAPYPLAARLTPWRWRRSQRLAVGRRLAADRRRLCSHRRHKFTVFVARELASVCGARGVAFRL